MALNGLMGAANLVASIGAVSQVPSDSAITNASVDSYSLSPAAELYVRLAGFMGTGILGFITTGFAESLVTGGREGFIKAAGAKPAVVIVILGGMTLLGLALTGVVGSVAFGTEKWRNRVMGAVASAVLP